jgi:tRNA pseudouridine38-40 synthase
MAKPDGGRNVLGLFAYDGSGFKGWQRLHGSQRTVQETLELGLAALCGRPCNAIGAGRSDAGVHAEGQAANFRPGAERPLAELGAALNALLPPELRCLALREALPNFHARYRAVSKRYAYRLFPESGGGGAGRSAMGAAAAWRAYSLAVRGRLDRRAMDEALSILVGRRSFRAMTNAKADARGFERELSLATAAEAGPFLDLIFEGDGFLYNQARLMAAAVLACGQGSLRPAALATALAAGDRAALPGALGAYGLRLVSVGFRDEDFLGPWVAVGGCEPGAFLSGAALGLRVAGRSASGR